MEIVKVTIKKSKNVHAWSRQFVGQTISVYANAGFGYENGYKVIFEENENLKPIHNRWLTGILHFEDAEIKN